MALFGGLFYSDNAEFFDTASKQTSDGAKWHWVGKQPVNPEAKSIPLQVEGGDPYILWRLKKD